MMKQLRAVVKECREVLEKEVLAHTPSAQLARFDEAELDDYVRDTVLALLIELAMLRCIEVRERAATSVFSVNVDWDTLRCAVSQKRHKLQACIPFPLQWVDLSAFIISDTALATLSDHLIRSISPDDWRTDHILGWIYESFQANSPEQKRYGRFYTPEAVTGTIVEQAFEVWKSELTPRPPLLKREEEQEIVTSGPSPEERGENWPPLAFQERGSGGEFTAIVLDLGCGCGAFTLQAFERIFQHYRAEERVVDNLASHILAHHLFLIDSDSWACQIAALSLYLKAISLDPDCRLERLNLVCADALQRWEDGEHIECCNAKKLFTRRYDLVIGNPPYSVVNQLRAPQELIRLYKSYRSAAYKINTFSLFVERGIDLLKPCGVLGMVVPNTALTQMYFEPLRRYILDTCKIARILDTKRVFDTAFVENCILLLQREEHAPRRSEHQVECVAAQCQTSGIDEAVHTPLHCIVQRHFERAPFRMFHIHCDDVLSELLEYIAHDAPTLGEICESHDGVNPGNAKGKLIVSAPLDSTCKKVLNGKNIQRYRLQWDGLYVRYDRSLLTKGDNVRWGHREALDSAKILTRQTADRIIGTFDAGQYYVTNSIHTTIMRPEYSAVSLKYVLALLNSKLLSWYYRKLFPEVGQVFSQVKLVNLRQLPIRVLSPDGQQEIVALVEQLLDETPCAALSARPEASATHGLDAHEQWAGRIQELGNRLDRLVYAAYTLSPDQIRLVERESGA